MQIAFEDLARPLALIHALSAIVLVGALTHGSVFFWLAGRKAQAGNIRRAENFWRVVLTSLTLTLLSGSLAYPTYRIRTRADYLDANYPTVAGIFDIKENYAALVLVLIIACWLLRKEPADTQARSLLHNGMYYSAAALAWFSFTAGLWVVLHRGIG